MFVWKKEVNKMKLDIENVIRTKVEFSGVPKGMEGTVIDIEEKHGKIEYMIQWENKIVDWFSQDEVDDYLELVE
jgi:hypothetical protein